MNKIYACMLAMLGMNYAWGQQAFENTDVEGFARLIANSDVVVLDVRTDSEYVEGHIEKAINIDFKKKDFVEKATSTLPADKTIAIYCRSGRRSAGAATLLTSKGFKLVNLKGGIIAWTEAQKPIVTPTDEK
ncbi:MAG: rhodanese-like domain-containing protein [Prevotella sp.]|nr:rhodanese-like domain-containing protein [Prevotella sp.]